MCVQKTSRKIKVLFVHSSSELYGSDRSLLNIIRGIDKTKYEVHVILPCEGPLCVELRQISDVELTIFDVAVLRRKNLNIHGIFVFLVNLICSVKYIEKYIKNNYIDIVDTNTAVVFPGAIAARRMKKKSVWHIREIIKNKFENKVISVIMNLFSDIIVANSKSTAQSLQVPKDKIRIVYNAVNTGELLGVSKSTSKSINVHPIVGMAGRINRWKGQKLFVDAASEVHDRYPDVEFWIAGDTYAGEEYLRTDLTEYIHDRSLENKVKLLGQVKNMNDFYQKIDIFVLPSIKPEPFGLVILEAMEHKIPVIATNHGGPTEIIKNGETGFLVDYNSSEMMAKTIEMLIEKPLMRKSIGENSFRYAQQNFSVDVMIKKIEAIFSDLYKG